MGDIVIDDLMDKNKIRVSVIIPVFNMSGYIERCIESVMRQSFNDLECIIVDDASPDDSILKCERMIDTYDGPIRFKIIHHLQNRGLSAARNTGTDAASGDYILYIDSDDAISPDCLEKMIIPVVNDEKVEMVLGNYMQIPFGSKNGPCLKKHENKYLTTRSEIRKMYFDDQIIVETAWNKLIKKEFIDRNGIRFREGVLWEDLLWTFYALKHLSHLYLIEDVTYMRYMRPDSICEGTDKEKKSLHYGFVFDEISRNLSVDDSRREALFYLKKLFRKCYDSPDNKRFRLTAHRFRSVLTWRYDAKEIISCFVICILSRSRMGRNIIKAFYGNRDKKRGYPAV